MTAGDESSTMPDSAPRSAGGAHAVTAETTPARNVLTELVGTSLLMLGGPGLIVLTDGRLDTLSYALGFGVSLALVIGVVGALANPALTLAMMIVREISVGEAVGDWIGQIGGAIVGGLMIWGINDQTRSAVAANGWDRNGLGALGTAFAAELAFGVILVAVLLLTVSQGHGPMTVGGATGAAYMVGHLVLLSIDGGGLNPARSIGSAMFSSTSPNALGQVWLFVVVPLVAAIVGVFIWLLIDDATVDDTVFDETFVDTLADTIDGTRD